MIQSILSQGEKHGFSTVEMFREKKEWQEYERYNGHIFFHEVWNNHLTVRAFRESGDPVGFYLSNPTDAAMKRAFSQVGAVNIPDQKPNFADYLPVSVQKVGTNIFDPTVESFGRKDFEALLERLDEHLQEFPDLSLRKVRLLKILKKIYVANTNGLNGKYKKSQFNLIMSLASGDNMVEINENKIYFAQLDPGRTIIRGDNLLRSLTDRPDKDARTRYLILAPEASALVLKEFSHHFKLKEQSRLPNMLFSPVLNIVDDPSLDGQSGSVIFDDEGVQSRGAYIIEKGAFSGAISNVETAFLNNRSSSGNGFRPASTPFPQVQFSNLYIKPTVLGLDTLMKEAGRGILVSLAKVKLVERDGIVFSAYGYRFRGVDRGQPVHFHFKTSFLSYFMKVLRVSKEIKFFHSQFNVGSPFLLVEGKYKSPSIFEI